MTTPELDEILTPACGFIVLSAINLRGVELTVVDGHPAGPLFQAAIRNDVTFTGPSGKTVTFIERGAESFTLNRDGTVTFALAGRQFGDSLIGRRAVRFDPTTGDVLSITQVGRSVNLDDLCAALAP